MEKKESSSLQKKLIPIIKDKSMDQYLKESILSRKSSSIKTKFTNKSSNIYKSLRPSDEKFISNSRFSQSNKKNEFIKEEKSLILDKKENENLYLKTGKKKSKRSVELEDKNKIKTKSRKVKIKINNDYYQTQNCFIENLNNNQIKNNLGNLKKPFKECSSKNSDFKNNGESSNLNQLNNEGQNFNQKINLVENIDETSIYENHFMLPKYNQHKFTKSKNFTSIFDKKTQNNKLKCFPSHDEIRDQKYEEDEQIVGQKFLDFTKNEDEKIKLNLKTKIDDVQNLNEDNKEPLERIGNIYYDKKERKRVNNIIIKNSKISITNINQITQVDRASVDQIINSIFQKNENNENNEKKLNPKLKQYFENFNKVKKKVSTNKKSLKNLEIKNNIDKDFNSFCLVRNIPKNESLNLDNKEYFSSRNKITNQIKNKKFDNIYERDKKKNILFSTNNYEENNQNQRKIKSKNTSLKKKELTPNFYISKNYEIDKTLNSKNKNSSLCHLKKKQSDIVTSNSNNKVLKDLKINNLSKNAEANSFSNSVYNKNETNFATSHTKDNKLSKNEIKESFFDNLNKKIPKIINKISKNEFFNKKFQKKTNIKKNNILDNINNAFDDKNSLDNMLNQRTKFDDLNYYDNKIKK
jgi:hypothetical protein